MRISQLRLRTRAKIKTKPKMLEQIGKQLAKAEYKVYSPAPRMVLLLIFAWAFSGWLVTQNIVSQLDSANDIRLASKTSSSMVYAYEQTNIGK